MLKEDLTIFEYRMQKEKKFTDIIKQERLLGRSEKISYFTVSCGYIDGYIYRPENYDKSFPLPIIFNFHGGGMVLSYCEQDAKYCQLIADKNNVAVINMDYAVAPEYKYPLPILSSYEFISKLSNDADKYNLDRNKIAVMGHSAGGYISAALCILNHEKQEFGIKALVANYPVLRQDKNVELRQAKDLNKAIPVSRMQQYYNWYFEQDSDPSEWLASPCNAPGKIFPPTLIQSAEYDALVEEEEEFYHNLKQEGIEVKYKMYKNCMHGFTHDCLEEFNELASEEAWETISVFLKKHLNK
ncbi:alpha/beta hydrolase [Globicatella sulfidifaciens]|uniref:Alpha/beta hydrolase n=1 Tax=Globicatella sulfidifaciens TaxID=136093 RepID=A0A7X8C253_9LACT|nr:alpha/beta hydrolase [Globicatella sulfidifaciens]NLJ17596.1 alpha/beta hydrolase [Globicatella sulfidifaciens]